MNLLKKIFALLFLLIILLGKLTAQMPDPAQLERLKQMAESMKNMTPEQVRKSADSLMKAMKKMTNLRDSIHDDVVTKVAKKLPNSKDMLASSQVQKYDTAYVSVKYSYTATIHGHETGTTTINGGSESVPMLVNGHNKRILAFSAKSTAAKGMNDIADMRGVSRKFANAYSSLTGVVSLAYHNGMEDGYIDKNGNTLADDPGLTFSFVYDSVQNFSSCGVGAAINIVVSEKLGLKGSQHNEVAMGGAGTSTDPSKAVIIGAPAAQSDPDYTPGTFTKTPQGFSVSYHKTKGIVTETFTADIGIKPQQYIAVIKPFERGNFRYRRWLPKGATPNNTDDTKGDDSLHFNIEVRDKKDSTKKFHGAYTVKWSLENVSRYPGICNNYPKYSESPDTDADLKFDSLMVDDPHFDAGQLTDSTATTRQGKGPGSLLHVLCMDYAAYGKLKAMVTLDDGTILDGVAYDTKWPYLSIPLDNNNNKIADAWERREGVLDNNYPANWDEDKLPENLGDHDGDGYTLLEEYRGFSANKTHFRASAKTKDLMVLDMIGERSKDGIGLFKDVTKIMVHDDFLLEEFGRETKDYEHEGLNHDKCLNYNYTPETHSVDQHGIAIVKSLERKRYAQAVSKMINDTTEMPIGTPKNYKYLEITLDFDPSPEGYNVVSGKISNATKATTDPRGEAKIISDNYAHTVAHEMLHCCNVKHHGSGDYKAVLIAGKYIPATTIGTYVIDPDKLYFVSGNTLYEPLSGYAYWEKGLRVEPEQIYNPANGVTLSIGVKGGQHSGFEDCIMRYRAANSYIDGRGYLFLIPTAPGYYPELAGIYLCNSKTGTGVNDKSKEPHRYGDATEGNCRHQFCINDKYH